MGGSHKSDQKLQAKHQKLLSELLRQAGNEACADCGARFPRYASVTFGVFLCDRCFGIHRGIGTHISRTKSISLDAWSAEEVGIMKDMGNQRARAFWENNVPPGRTRPSEDTPDSVAESWIRDKYEKRQFCPRTQTARQLKASTSSVSDAGPSPPRPLLSSLALPTLSSLSSSLPLSSEKPMKEPSNIVAWASSMDGGPASNGGSPPQGMPQQSSRSPQTARTEKSPRRRSPSGSGEASKNRTSRREDSSLPPPPSDSARHSWFNRSGSRRRSGSSSRSLSQSSADGIVEGSKPNASEPVDPNWDPFGKDAESSRPQDHIVRSRSADHVLDASTSHSNGTPSWASDWLWPESGQQRSQQPSSSTQGSGSVAATGIMELELLPQQRHNERGVGAMGNGGMNGFDQGGYVNGSAQKSRVNNPFAKPDLHTSTTGVNPGRAITNGQKQWEGFSFPVPVMGNEGALPLGNNAAFGWAPMQQGNVSGGVGGDAVFEGGMTLGPHSRSASAPDMGALDLQANNGAAVSLGLLPVRSDGNMNGQGIGNGFGPSGGEFVGMPGSYGRNRELTNGGGYGTEGDFQQQHQMQHQMQLQMQQQQQQQPGVWLGGAPDNATRPRSQQKADPFANLMSGFGNMRLGSKGDSGLSGVAGALGVTK